MNRYKELHYTHEGEKKKYIVDRHIIITMIILITILAITPFLIYGLDNHYLVTCLKNANEGRCINPYYDRFNPCTHECCSEEIIFAGETCGTPEPPLFTITTYLIFITFTLGLIVNHLRNN